MLSFQAKTNFQLPRTNIPFTNIIRDTIELKEKGIHQTDAQLAGRELASSLVRCKKFSPNVLETS